MPASEARRMKAIGLIGVGAMGEPMGAALLRAGFSLNICAHKSRERVDRLVALGAAEKPDPAGVAAGSEVIITMVPDAAQVDQALFGERGVTRAEVAGRTIIDMSTISPVRSREFHEWAQSRGYAMLDAPVSGGPARAATGELAIMVGGDAKTFAACEPILKALGKPTHVGPAGMGETVKLVNQVIIAGVMIANIEGLVFAKKAGADVDVVRKVLAGATASNYLLEQWLPKTWFAGSHEGGFAIDLLRKDLRAALASGATMSVPMPMTALANELYTGVSARHGREDYSAVATLFEDAAGVKIGMQRATP